MVGMTLDCLARHDTPARCAASGVDELWIHDPLFAGPKREEGPRLLQIWRRNGNTFRRVYAGDGRHTPHISTLGSVRQRALCLGKRDSASAMT